MPDIPKQEQEDLVKFINELYDEANVADKQFAENRKENREFYKGKQWKDSKFPTYKSKDVTNFTSLVVRDETAILTDRRPTASVIPVDFKSDPKKSEIFQKILTHILYKNQIDLLNYKACKWANIEGIVYYRPVWDDSLADGQGDVKILIERKDDVKTDPSGEDNYFVIEKEVTLAEIYRSYPDYADKVKADLEEDSSDVSDSVKDIASPMIANTNGTISTTVGSGLTISEQHRKVNLRLAWIRDWTVEAVIKSEVKAEDVEDVKEETEQEYQAKYPNGRWITLANKKIIIEDKPCLVKEFPLVPLILDPDPETEVHGISTIDYTKGTQRNYNEMISLIKDYLKATVFPKVIYDVDSGFEPKKFKNKWGSMIGKQRGSEVKFEAPQPIPNNIFNYIEIEKDNLEYVSGIRDVSHGMTSGGVTAASAINLLQEASKTLIRPKARALEGANAKLGKLILNYVQVGYTTPRTIRLLGDFSEETKKIDEEIAKLQQTLEVIKNDTNVDLEVQAKIFGEQQGKLNQLMQQKEQINMLEINQIQDVGKILNDVTVGEYDVMIEPDSTLPLSRIERLAMMKEAAELGFIDREAYLRETGLRNWTEINNKMSKKEEEMKAMQQQQMLMQAPPGGNPEQQPA